ncbi:[citrate (pro-3S)-lyase] ligase [Lactobacillus sp. CBA3605]|uniref:[citrate (pro-3S)-lyase] ligase n=1 Tax=Lactobacillus sp. CBA3605 TaxID=2099788 RepID=UPI000CFBA0EB|nr:[citrate (pro-3S)-lyase] ligase [Lactobacillus sp. CBA3605]AVK61792.1 [citrate (pro-3S)-lyase] ligase [Lactobacillus sp. CBA3605]
MTVLKQLWFQFEPSVKQQWRELLVAGQLVPDEQVDYTVGIYDGSQLIGTGSLYQNIIKCVAIDPAATQQNLLAPLIKALLDQLTETQYEAAFVYTKPKTAPYFEAMGFKVIVTTAEVSLLEWGYPNFDDYQAYLRRHKRPSDNAAAIVMNANPFTLGHQYLIEQALKSSDVVYVFVVSEDRSQFKTATRLAMVRRAVAINQRVVVLETNHYLVSNATFPAYFLKDQANLAVAKTQACLDATLFLTKIKPVLAIQQRFVGAEPDSPVTQIYNDQMAQVFADQLPLTVVPRLQQAGRPISATTVRQALAVGDWATVAQQVPPINKQFLKGS